MDTQAAPQLAGIHHLKLPVTDLARSREWYRIRLGYRVQAEFVEHGQLMGYGLTHPDGGPPFALRLDSERARAAAGFDCPTCTTPTATRSASTPSSTTQTLTRMRSPRSTIRGKPPNGASRLPYGRPRE